MQTLKSSLGGLFRTALPLTLVTLAGSAARLADRLFLGHFSQTALAAVSPAFVLTGVFSCFILSVISYSGTFVAHNYGQRRHFAAVRTLGQGLWLAVLSIPLVFISIPIGNLLISALGHSQELTRAETTYFDIVMCAQALATLSAALSGYFTAERNARLVGVASVAGCLLNIVLDPLLIFGCGPLPALGLAGAAYAAAAGATLSAGLLLRPLVSKRLFTGPLRRHLAFNGKLVFRILRFALPNSIRGLVEMAVFYLFICTTAATGETALAVSNICLCVNGIFFAALDGTSRATAALVGQTRGSGNDSSTRKIPLQALRLLLLPFAIMAAVYLVGGRSITLLFGDPATDPSSFAELGLTLFSILILNDLCETAQNIYGSALLGVGDTRFALRCSLSAHLLVWTPLLVIFLAYHPSIVCCYLSSVIGRGIHALLLFWRWRSGKWRNIHLT